MGKVESKKFQTVNGENFVIRTALPEDADRVITFSKAVFAEAPYLLTTESEFQVIREQEQLFLQDLYNHEGKLALVVECGKEIIGFLNFQNGNKQRTKHEGSFGMSVKKEFRNQGIGRFLLSSLLEWAEGNTLIEKISLEVFEDNTSAISLYKSFGFIEEGVKRKAIKKSDGSYHDLLLMALWI